MIYGTPAYKGKGKDRSTFPKQLQRGDINICDYMISCYLIHLYQYYKNLVSFISTRPVLEKECHAPTWC